MNFKVLIMSKMRSKSSRNKRIKDQ